MHIDLVNPLCFIEEASLILRDSWSFPSLYYSAPYLQWRLQPLGLKQSLAAIALNGEEPVGFIGAVPQQLCFGKYHSEVFLISFVAVRPSWRGKGIAARLYQTLLEALSKREAIIVSFGMVDSLGDSLLCKVYPNAGYDLRKLTTLPTYSFREKRGASTPALKVDPVSSAIMLQDIMHLSLETTALSHVPSEMFLSRIDNDPRKHLSVVVSDGKRTIGGATITLAQIMGKSGIEELPMLENLFLLEKTPEILAALCRFAGRYWAESETPRIVNVPNTFGLDVEILASAGLRKTAAGFHAYLGAPNANHPFFEAKHVSLEIV